MAASAALEEALSEVRNQEHRVQLLEKLLIMALMGTEGQRLKIDPAFADAAKTFDGGFDIGNSEVRLISAEEINSHRMPPSGVAIRMFARTESDE